jgi:hypothetical protein
MILVITVTLMSARSSFSWDRTVFRTILLSIGCESRAVLSSKCQCAVCCFLCLLKSAGALYYRSNTSIGTTDPHHDIKTRIRTVNAIRHNVLDEITRHGCYHLTYQGTPRPKENDQPVRKPTKVDNRTVFLCDCRCKTVTVLSDLRQHNQIVSSSRRSPVTNGNDICAICASRL